MYLKYLSKLIMSTANLLTTRVPNTKSNLPVQDIIVMASKCSWPDGIIMDAPCGPVYEETMDDLPGRECVYIGKCHSKKKNKSARFRYENTKVTVVERPIPKNKKKKYPTKPKNRSKIEKMKSKNDDIKRMM